MVRERIIKRESVITTYCISEQKAHRQTHCDFGRVTAHIWSEIEQELHDFDRSHVKLFSFSLDRCIGLSFSLLFGKSSDWVRLMVLHIFARLFCIVLFLSSGCSIRTTFLTSPSFASTSFVTSPTSILSRILVVIVSSWLISLLSLASTSSAATPTRLLTIVVRRWFSGDFILLSNVLL